MLDHLDVSRTFSFVNRVQRRQQRGQFKFPIAV